MEPRIEVFGGGDCWRFAVIGANGRTIVTSEMYTCKRNAVSGANTLRDCIQDGCEIVVNS